jgi:hypothetical protein
MWVVAATACVPRAPTVATDEVCPLLLGHRNSDGTVAVGRLPIITEGYEPLVQRRIVVVVPCFCHQAMRCF